MPQACLSDFRPGSATGLLPRTPATNPCYVRHNYCSLNATTGEAERTVSDLDALDPALALIAPSGVRVEGLRLEPAAQLLRLLV